jgi:hypothetical protein
MEFKKTTEKTVIIAYFCYLGIEPKEKIIELKKEFPSFYFFAVRLRRDVGNNEFEHGIVAIPVINYDFAVEDNKDALTEWYSPDWIVREKKNFIYTHNATLKKFPKHDYDVKDHVEFIAMPEGTEFI